MNACHFHKDAHQLPAVFSLHTCMRAGAQTHNFFSYSYEYTLEEVESAGKFSCFTIRFMVQRKDRDWNLLLFFSVPT